MTGRKFDEHKAHHLDSRLRGMLIPARPVFDCIGPVRTETWAEIGCGTGHFTIPLASLVTKVYAMDISVRMLDALQEKLAEKNVTNVEVQQSQESSLPLAGDSVDGAFMAFVAHELEEPELMIRDLKRIVKPNGRLVVVEFTERSGLGPPVEHRLSEEKMDAWASAAGMQKGAIWSWRRSLLRWKTADFVGWEYRNTADP